MSAEPENDQRADDCDEGSALLLKHVLEGLRKGDCRASFLAVAHKVLNDERERLARERRLSATPDLSTLPFEAEALTGTNARLQETLARLPFAAPAADEGDAGS